MSDQAEPDTTPTRSEVAQWAISLGYDVSVRGNLPAGLIKRWNDEHPLRPFANSGRPPILPAAGEQLARYGRRGTAASLTSKRHREACQEGQGSP